MSIPHVDSEKFWDEGYLLIKNVFASDEIAELRDSALAVLAEQDAADPAAGAVCLEGELLSRKVLARAVLDDRILHLARQILGDRPIYFGDSSVMVGEGGRGWHKDNRLPDRFQHSALDWQGRYPLIRFGLYLQDHAHHSGGLGIRIGSHQPSSLVRRLEKFPIARLRAWASGGYGRPILVDSEAGDVVVWCLRTTHTGNSVRLKPMPNVKLGCWVEDLAPSWLRIEEEQQRVALFFTLGADGDHLRRYVEYLRTRGYMAGGWQPSSLDPETLALAESKDLGMIPL